MRALRLAAAARARRARRGLGGGRRDDRLAGPAGRRRALDPLLRLRRSASTWSAFHWQGSGRVLFRTRSQSRAAGAPGDARPRRARTCPIRRAAKTRVRGPAGTSATRTGSARPTASRSGSSGDVRRLRAWYVWSPVSHAAVRRVSMAGSPQIVPRAEWRANEAIKRAPPRYARTVSFAVVHHTAGTNAYSPRRSAAIVRGIELYHVRGNGWNDIGYNFLVDRYGQVFEGRAGGIASERDRCAGAGVQHRVGRRCLDRQLQHRRRSPPRSGRRSSALLAWRLDVAHVDPLGTVGWVSGGNPKYRAGKTVELRAISGHRDTGSTSCPGTRLYSQLPSIAADVAATGLPKLYAPRGQGVARRADHLLRAALAAGRLDRDGA